MIEHPIEGDFFQWVVNAFRQSMLFSALDKTSIDKIISFSRLVEFEPNEVIIRESDASANFWVLLMGEARAHVTDGRSGEPIEVEVLRTHATMGELGMLLETPRSATVTATRQTYAVQFDRPGFEYLMERIPGFARRMARVVAERLVESTARTEFPQATSEEAGAPTADIVTRFPKGLYLERRIVPLRVQDGVVTVAFVDPPDHETATQVRRHIGELGLRIVRLSMADYDGMLDRLHLRPTPEPVATAPVAVPATPPETSTRAAALAAVEQGGMPQLPLREPTSHRPALPTLGSGSHKSVVARVQDLSRVEPILRRMIQMGASDLHMSAMQRPRWRIDGEMFEISDFGILGEDEAMELLGSLMPDRSIREFAEHHDADFAFAVEDLARFRVNIYRDEHGISAVLRLVPMHTPGMDQLGVPKAAREFTALHSGLVLVCGPTGSGKSTTLSAMIDHINNTRRVHIITIEDPIEFLHESKVAKVTQREVGKNTSGFQRALRSSLREDPDIVLVGELRDRETLELALKTAQTGHLVLSTLHTSTAIGTIDRIIDMFPSDQHDQVRSVLADVLKGVINQHLCKRIGGGRIAAFECLVGGSAVSNCIRQGKNHQIETVMTTNKSQGHRMMNMDLTELVRSNAIDVNEALAHAPDRKDLRARLGMPAS